MTRCFLARLSGASSISLPFGTPASATTPGSTSHSMPTRQQTKSLSNCARPADPIERSVLYEKFQAELEKDIPAVFLYAPDFVYSFPNDIKGLTLGFIETPSDRFLSILGVAHTKSTTCGRFLATLALPTNTIWTKTKKPETSRSRRSTPSRKELVRHPGPGGRPPHFGQKPRPRPRR